MADPKLLLDAGAIQRSLTRIAHEIAEANADSADVGLIGIQRGGVPLAKLLGEMLGEIYGHEVAVGSVEPGLHRDDLSQRGMSELRPTEPVSYTHLTLPTILLV